MTLIPSPASIIPDPVDDLDQLVRRVDEDRWLATQFAPAAVRERLIAIYAVNYEIARTAEMVSEGGLGDIRLEWWRSALDEIVHGNLQHSHPALAALTRTMPSPAARALQDIVAARSADFEPQPFGAWSDVDVYLDRTAGVLMRLCIEQCSSPRPAPEAFITSAGRAWGLTGLLRAAPYWHAKGRSALPREGGDISEMRERARTNFGEVRALARSLPHEVFPAIGYLAVVPGYLRAHERGYHETPLFGRKAAMIAVSATGRF